MEALSNLPLQLNGTPDALKFYDVYSSPAIIGHGAFGMVFRVVKAKQTVAVKVRL